MLAGVARVIEMGKVRVVEKCSSPQKKKWKHIELKDWIFFFLNLKSKKSAGFGQFGFIPHQFFGCSLVRGAAAALGAGCGRFVASGTAA